MHDDAPLQTLRDRAPLFPGAIEGEGEARRRVQPLQRACDAKPGFVEAANLRLGHALADALINLLQFLRLLSHPGDDAGRTDQRRADEIAQRLRGPILGDELLDIEIDRRRLEALAILRRRNYAFGKRRLGHAPAMRAAVDRGLMFRDHERAFGKVEHRARLDPYRRLRFKRRTAMTAHARLVPNPAIGIGDLPQRPAFVALLPAARLARGVAQAAGVARLLPQPVARRRLRTVGTVLAQSPAQIGHLSLERRDLAPERGNQLFDFGGKTHPTLDSYSQPAVSKNPPIKRLFHATCDIPDSPHLGSYLFYLNPVQPIEKSGFAKINVSKRKLFCYRLFSFACVYLNRTRALVAFAAVADRPPARSSPPAARSCPSGWPIPGAAACAPDRRRPGRRRR